MRYKIKNPLSKNRGDHYKNVISEAKLFNENHFLSISVNSCAAQFGVSYSY